MKTYNLVLHKKQPTAPRQTYLAMWPKWWRGRLKPSIPTTVHKSTVPYVLELWRSKLNLVLRYSMGSTSYHLAARWRTVKITHSEQARAREGTRGWQKRVSRARTRKGNGEGLLQGDEDQHFQQSLPCCALVPCHVSTQILVR